ncbi:MAG: hypothetical protein JW801_17150 [Bacteroidales bacterium]|nr:hypothetical protein [Bacteroidales bacterium]
MVSDKVNFFYSSIRDTNTCNEFTVGQEVCFEVKQGEGIVCNKCCL